MKQRVDLVAVMPIGPNSRLAFITDSLNSLIYYTGCSYKIILMDDSRKNIGMEVKKIFPHIVVLKSNKMHGKYAALYANLCTAFKYALDNYRFDVLMKMDDDALVTGRSPERYAMNLFEEHPDIGMAGRHFSGKYSTSTLGDIHDNSFPRNTLLTGTCTWKFIKRPIVNFTLRKLMFTAIRKGYEIGENILGGAYYMSEKCLLELDRLGYLPLKWLRNSILSEDHLFSLLTCAAGFRLGDLENGMLPLGVAWRGLPASPETLRERGKKVIHSIRYWKDRKEEEIRAYFHQYRIDS